LTEPGGLEEKNKMGSPRAPPPVQRGKEKQCRAKVKLEEMMVKIPNLGKKI
jgi:hypothetical protein